jgi:molecular chaperone IbpA
MEDMDMRDFDFSPFARSSIGFDRFFELLDAAGRLGEPESGYPPYNIEKLGEDAYRITMAVAGFDRDELQVVARQNTLTIAGRKRNEESRQYLHRGLATRAFERQFNLADYVRVSGANLENGLLSVDLVREVPDEVKPRRVEIGAGAPPSLKSIEAKAA